MSQDLGRDVPDLEQLYARKLSADFRSLNTMQCITLRYIKTILICSVFRPNASFALRILSRDFLAFALLRLSLLLGGVLPFFS